MPDAVMQNWKVSDRARALHADALIWDAHAGFEPKPSVDLEILENWRAAGVDFLSVNVGYDVVPWQNTVKNIGAFITWLEKHADRFTLVRRVDDILAAKREGKLAIAFDIEGMDSLDGQAYMVSFYYRLGVRQMLFAYNLNNLAGGGCHDQDSGLTAIRPRGDRRDEPGRHDRRLLPYRLSHDPGGDRGLERAGDLLPFQSGHPAQARAQHRR